ncbi:hypothetical protein KCU72_g18398, partial [Aureobasidium melanogenum]
LDRLLAACDQTGDILQLKFSSGIAGGREPIPDGLMNVEEMEHREDLAKGKTPTYQPPRWKLEDIIKRGVQDVKAPLF